MKNFDSSTMGVPYIINVRLEKGEDFTIYLPVI